MRDRILSGDVMMDMLRGAPATGRRVAYLIETGHLFGFSENTVRVTLSRLQARGLIRSPERGRYKLAETADPINEFVERWRLGEARVRSWTPGQWLFAHTDKAADDRCHWALDALGLRPVRPALHVRPDNLALSPGSLRQLGVKLGMPKHTLVITGRTDERESADWMSLWPGEDLNRQYRDMTARLKESARRLPSLSREEARLESFRLGGAGIHSLAKDPLLPAAFVDAESRRDLWQTMIDYEKQGTAIWAQNRVERDNSLPVPRLAESR